MLNRITSKIHLKVPRSIPTANKTTFRHIARALRTDALKPTHFLAAHIGLHYDPTHAHFPPLLEPTISLHPLYDSLQLQHLADTFHAKANREARLRLPDTPSYLSRMRAI